jgi:hypothetical protein
MKRIAFVTSLLVLAGCASLSLVPGPEVLTDPYDGAKIIRQTAASASASAFGDNAHQLGFEWYARTPDRVYLEVSVPGITNITGVAFRVGPEEIVGEAASAITDYGSFSTRRFSVSMSDFRKLANAPAVKMKVLRINRYTVSEFGSEREAVAVSSKFLPFLAKIAEVK